MGLRDIVEADLGGILEDSVYGFGWPITVTDPQGLTDTFTGFSNDVAQLIDPDTGEAISGRTASVALRLSTLYAAGFATPENIANAASKFWKIQFNDINGNPYTFKVIQSNPDRAMGIVTCLLQVAPNG